MDELQSYLDRFGLSTFRRGQREIIADILQGHDTLAVMPTGGGKSLCYQLPAVHREGTVVVVTPLISLMRDQVRTLRERNIPAGCIYADQSAEDKRHVFQMMNSSESFLLYLSPERVQKAGFVEWFRTARISLIAIDEAHCVSQWGHDFRKDYHRLDSLRAIRPEIPMIALTATATPQVLQDIASQLKLQQPKQHVYGFYRPNLYYQVELCADESEKYALLVNALQQTPEGRIIIYAGTRKRCEALCASLTQHVAQIDYYHAGMTTDERTRIQESFDTGATRILIATNAFGMGVDQPNIRLIVHYQMPGTIEAFYQEMGRAGRDGQDSTCLLLYARKDKGLHAYFITRSKAPKAVLNQRWRALDMIVQFAEGGECRHGGILTYFRDTQRIEVCGHCDICAPTSERRKRCTQPVPHQLPTTHSKKRKTKKKSTGRRTLTNAEELRYEAIREWRQAYAAERDLPAFVICSNKTLHDLIIQDPHSLTALERVYGLGAKKIEAFGPELLEQLAQCRS
jgi:ATP-dependent DNA helicase RecQ